jgi:hypothetical protein
MSATPSPQPSPSRGEGVTSQRIADVEQSRLLDFEVAIETINILAYEIPPRPLWERAGERGC